MRLKRLELQGFKSFLDRTILNFDDSITGVVGPNGCGKSNIVDAILWVMGEQSPKHLRGESMTDVIFNGSDTKQPVSMAEVSLVLDRRGVPLAPQFSIFERAEEIAVTRRIYRDGTGEYFINKTKCRLKDVHELFMDTGVGRRAYSIIEQGQIDRMINVKPEDRRLLFEEVAGITKYKAKRREAEKKLENTRLNLERLQDIINELEKRIRSLKVQASRAQKYKELKGELETADLFLLGRKAHTSRRLLEELAQSRADALSGRSESDARIGELDANLTVLEVKRVDEEKLIQELSQKERDLSLHLQRLESEVSLLEQRKAHLSESCEAAEKEEAEYREQIEVFEAEGARLNDSISEVEEELVRLEESIQEREARVKSFHEEKAKVVRRREGVERQRQELAEKEITLNNRVEHAQTREQEVQARRDELNETLTELVVALQESKTQLETVDQQIEDCRNRSAQAESDTAQANEECQKASSALSAQEEELFNVRENFHGVRSRYESLKELQENLEGYSPTAKEILTKLEDTESFHAVPLAEILKPDVTVEDHLEAILGNDINTLVVETKVDAVRLSAMIREKELERVRIISIEEASQAQPVDSSISVDLAAQPILERVEVTQGYESVGKLWLGKVYICADADALMDLRERYPQLVFLTEDSRTIAHEDRSLSAGLLPSKTGVFARRREIDELETASAALEAQLGELSNQREKQLEYLKSQEQLRTEMKDKLSSLHVESMEFRKEREKIQLSLSRTDREYESLRSESERAVNQLEDIRGNIESWNEELSGLGAENESLIEEFIQVEEEERKLVESHESLTQELGEFRVERSARAEKINSLRAQWEGLQGDIKQASRRIESLKQQREREQEELRTISTSFADVEEQKVSSEAEKNETLVRLSDTKESFETTCTDIQECRNELSQLRKHRDEILNKIQELELEYATREADLKRVRETCEERYNIELVELDENARVDVEKLPLLTEQLEVTFELLLPEEQQPLLEEHTENIRKKVGRYGEVNLTAIQEYDEIQERYTFLMDQHTDLEKSIGILEEAIVKINESTKARFEDTFLAVQRKFREIFPILFNGGKAELQLTNSEDLLEAGVDIMVQPPGKRLQSITLLSGGEKALTAVSLVLAIFARKPSPFCLLDEVDAPLDDANVSRFNTVIRKMSEKTQFIVITHNKKTMEITESLFGVTMERAGISKMASVRLQ